MATATIKAKATLDNRQFQTGVAQMSQGVERFKNTQLRQLGGIIGGAFAAGAVINFAKKQMMAADATADLARNIGISTEALQALEASAEQFGGTVEQLATGLIALRRRSGAALAGNEGYRKSFERLGISMEELETLNTPALFERVAQGYRDAGQSAQALDAVDQALSESGRRLAGVLVDVADNGLQGLIDKGKEAGTVLSNDVTNGLAEANNELEKTARQLTNIGTTLLAGAIDKIKTTAAFIGAVSGGASLDEAAMIAGNDSLERKQSAVTDAIKTSIELDIEREQKAVKAPKIAAQAPDQIAKIGGIIGAQGISNQERMAREQLELQRMANQQLTLVAEATKTTSNNTAVLTEDA